MWAVRGGMDDGTGGARTSPLPPGLGRSSVLGPPFRVRFPSEPILKSRVAHREHQSAPGFGSRIHPIELGWLGEDGELGDPAGITASQPRAFPPPPPLLQEHELPDWGSLPVGGCRIWVQIQPRNGHREPLQGGLKPWECPFGSAGVPVPTVLEQDAARGRLPSLP